MIKARTLLALILGALGYITLFVMFPATMTTITIAAWCFILVLLYNDIKNTNK
jgi:hypothetical protein